MGARTFPDRFDSADCCLWTKACVATFVYGSSRPSHPAHQHTQVSVLIHSSSERNTSSVFSGLLLCGHKVRGRFRRHIACQTYVLYAIGYEKQSTRKPSKKNQTKRSEDETASKRAKSDGAPVMLEPQSRFRTHYLKLERNCPENGAAVLKVNTLDNAYWQVIPH